MKSVLLFYAIIVIFLGSTYAQSSRKKVAQGNRLYSEEKYDEANNKYQDALLEDPGSFLIPYNVGDVLYKKKNYDKALESYQKALNSTDPLFQSQTYYNQGNALYRQGKLEESILAYEQALKLNPNDEDAKYNLEFVRNKLKENADKNKDQNQQQEQQQQEQQQKEQKQESSQNQDEKKDQEQKQNPMQNQEKAMSEEQAKQLLDLLKEKQKDLKRKMVQAQGKTRVLKDW